MENHTLTKNGSIVQQEILSQPSVWRQVIQRFSARNTDLALFLAKIKGQPLLLTGCGITYALALSTAHTFQLCGVNARALPASELAAYDYWRYEKPAGLIVFSRSGSTSETLWAVETYRRVAPGGQVLLVSTQANSPLTRLADAALVLPECAEQAVVETRSFTGMALAAALLAHRFANENDADAWLTLPDDLERLWQGYSRQVEELGRVQPLQRFFFLGSGGAYGLAQAGMFLMKELCGAWSEAFLPLEFRHGPWACVDETSLVICFLSDGMAEQELRLLKELRDFGARILMIHGDFQMPKDEKSFLSLKFSSRGEMQRGILAMPFLQWLGLQHTLLLGKNPDQPARMRSVTHLE